jgi:hypothetical protein
MLDAVSTAAPFLARKLPAVKSDKEKKHILKFHICLREQWHIYALLLE